MSCFLMSMFPIILSCFGMAFRSHNLCSLFLWKLPKKFNRKKRDMQIKGKNWISKKSENQHFSLSTAKYCLPPMLSQLTNGWCHILIWIFSFWHLVYSEGRPRLNIYVMRELCLIANILLSGIFSEEVSFPFCRAKEIKRFSS